MGPVRGAPPKPSRGAPGHGSGAMSAPLARAKAAVMPLLSTAREAIGSRYGKLMADNAQFVVQDKAAEDKLLKQCVHFVQGGWGGAERQAACAAARAAVSASRGRGKAAPAHQGGRRRG